MTTAEATLAQLRAGNQRFIARVSDNESPAEAGSPYQLMQKHAPSAIIVGCADARVPVEIIFDQNIGSLFVVRVAGNVVTPTQLGSVEFAAEQFGVSLVVVLGHSRCGAVDATLQTLRQGSEPASPNLREIVDCIRPGLEPLLDASQQVTDETLLEQAVRANIKSSVARMRHDSAVLQALESQGKLTIVGAEYCLDSGQVEFLDAG